MIIAMNVRTRRTSITTTKRARHGSKTRNIVEEGEKGSLPFVHSGLLQIHVLVALGCTVHTPHDQPKLLPPRSALKG